MGGGKSRGGPGGNKKRGAPSIEKKVKKMQGGGGFLGGPNPGPPCLVVQREGGGWPRTHHKKRSVEQTHSATDWGKQGMAGTKVSTKKTKNEAGCEAPWEKPG